MPITTTDERVLNVIEGEVLTPSFIDIVLDSVFVPDETDCEALEAEASDFERELANLTAAIKSGGQIPILVEELAVTHARLLEIRGRLAPQPQEDSRAARRAALEQRVTEWRQILRTNPQQGRQVLRHLVGTITLWMVRPKT